MNLTSNTKRNLTKSFLAILIIFFYSPILSKGDLRYFLPEMIIYFVLGSYLFFRRLQNLKVSKVSKILIRYLLIYVLVILITLLLKGVYYPVYIQQFRLVFYTTVFYLFLDNYFEYLDKVKIFEILNSKLIYFGLAPIISIIIFFNDNARNIIYSLYVPIINKFDSVGYVFAGFREPGIFKDYYTSTIFLFTLFAFIIAKNSFFRNKYSIIDYAILLVSLSSTIVTGRTGLLFCLFYFLITFFLSHRSFKFGYKLILFPIIIMSSYFLVQNQSNSTLEWALEIFKSDGLKTNSSDTLLETFREFFIYLNYNDNILFIPLHPESFGIKDISFYSDSFLVQEVIRHGIWGVLNYLLLVFSLIRIFGGNKYIQLIIIFLFIANFKGGNVFFMERYNLFLWSGVFLFYKYQNKK